MDEFPTPELWHRSPRRARPGGRIPRAESCNDALLPRVRLYEPRYLPAHRRQPHA
ncbi:MAG: hypothetical protein ACLTSX_09430 [Collinsella sp.]